MKYYSKVVHCAYGKCLIALKFLSPGSTVQKFKGKIVAWENISNDEICYVLQIEDKKWMIPKSDAKYINHSCDPNCIIDDNLQIVTNRPIFKGEELTISYNIVHNGEDPGIWDERWTFKCQCKAPSCQGMIDKYITSDRKPWSPNNIINPIERINRDKLAEITLAK